MVRIELKAIAKIAARALMKYCVLASMFDGRFVNTDFRIEQKVLLFLLPFSCTGMRYIPDLS